MPWSGRLRSSARETDDARVAYHNWIAFGAFFAVGLIAYWSTLGGGLQIDDFSWFDATMHRGIMGEDHIALHFWRPLLSVVFWSLWKLFGVRPFVFRIFNLLLTAFVAYSVRAIWLRVCPEEKTARWSGLALGLLFVIWPAHPETIAWIAGMTDGLAIALAAAGVWAYLVYRQDQRPLPLIVSLFLFAGALLSKEAALPFPLIAVGMASFLAPWKKTERLFFVRDVILMLGLIAVYVVIRQYMIGRLVGGYMDTSANVFSRIFGDNTVVNLSHSYVPFDRFVATNFGPQPAEGLAMVLLGGAALIGIFLWKKERERDRNSARARYLKLALLFFSCSFVALAPAMIANLATGFEVLSRWTYAATFFSVMALGAFFFAVWSGNRTRARALGLVSLISICQLAPAVASWRQSGIVSNRTSALVASLLPARRIYVLAFPADVSGAGLFEFGLIHMASILGSPNTQVVFLFGVIGFHEGDTITAKKIDAQDYSVTITADPSLAREEPFLICYSPAQVPYFATPSIDPQNDEKLKDNARFVKNGLAQLIRGTTIHLNGFDPKQDRVLVVNGETPERLDHP